MKDVKSWKVPSAINPERCEKIIYEKGHHFATLDSLSSEWIEDFVQRMSEKSGQRMDWHWFAGRAIVKVHPDDDFDVAVKVWQEMEPEFQAELKRKYPFL